MDNCHFLQDITLLRSHFFKTSSYKFALHTKAFLYLLLITFSISNTFSQEIETTEKLETVNLQLKWFHQFQFSGYYAAKEQGYYAEQGLSVNFIERSPDINVVDQVVSGIAEYGIEDTGILVSYANGKPIKALATIFQHNPFIFLSKQSSGIVSPYEMIGKRVMFDIKDGKGAEEVPLQALLAETGVSKDSFIHIASSFDKSDLINDKTDVISGYITNAPFYFAQRSIKVNIINPLNYGIDFYGDLLFTSKKELENFPGRAEKFRKASLKGWQYALDHPEEMIQLIKTQYASKLSIEALHYEAKQIYKLILPEQITLGEIKPSRLKQVAKLYTKLNISPELTDKQLKEFTNLNPGKLNLSIEEKSWLQQHPNITFTGNPDWLPYEAFDKKGNYIGIVSEYLTKIENLLGINISIIPSKSWSGAVEKVEKGEIDIISETVGSNLESTMNFTKPYLSSPIVITMLKDEPYVDNINQISTKNIALIKDYGYVHKIIKKYPYLNIYWVNTINEGHTAVSTGKVDALFSTLAHSIYNISKNNLTNIRIVGKTEFTNNLAFGIQQDLSPLVPLFNRAIDSISETEKQNISNAWGEEKYTKKVDYQPIINISIILLFLIISVFLWNRKLSKEIVKRKKIEGKLKLASTVYHNTNQAIMVTDENNLIVAINPSFTKLTGYTIDEVNGKNPNILRSDRQDSNFYHRMWESINSTGHWQGEIWNTRKNGEEYAEILTINTIYNDDNKVLQRVGLFTDITEKKLIDEKIWKQANFDELTQLANRTMFTDRLAQEIRVSQRSGKSIALFFLDLDHFKEVNDALGHDKGDILLIEAAKRIQDCVRKSDTVARLGGDEFSVILSPLNKDLHVERIAEDIVKSLSLPFTLEVEEAYVSVSIGIALFPNDTDQMESLIKYADQAMYLAKTEGRNQFSFFTKSMQLAAHYRHQLMNDLRSALKDDQLQLYYQPIVNLKSGKIEKAEALLRWIHPTRGIVSPVEFIPLAEDSGLIIEIGNWVFQQAVDQLKTWQQQYNTNLQISINKSPIQFRSTADFIDWMEYLHTSGVSGESLVIEITESLLIDNSDNIQTQLLGFRNNGIQVAIDDFGTGYSALSYLNKFNIDYLKIDRSFVSNLSPNSNELVLCEAIIVMAHKLGIKVIAEGIETEQQKQLLLNAGCDFGQGFLFSKPVTKEAFEKLWKQS